MTSVSKISAMILEKVAQGSDVKTAYESVMGKESYGKLAGEVWDSLNGIAPKALPVPLAVLNHASGCNSCLWAGCECTEGKLYKESQRGSPCANWSYYD